MLVPRLEGQTRLVWPDGTEQRLTGLSEALTERVMLMSREAARSLLIGQLWSLPSLGTWLSSMSLTPPAGQNRRTAVQYPESAAWPNEVTAGKRNCKEHSAAVRNSDADVSMGAVGSSGRARREGDPWFAEFSDIRAF